jgi:L-ribulose-5-phosphate 3-epimerase
VGDNGPWGQEAVTFPSNWRFGYTFAVHKVGVCSWSLRPKSPEELVERLRACGIAATQLAVDPLRDGRWNVEHTRDILGQAGIEILSGMMAMKGEDYSTIETIRATGGVRSDENWSTNLEAAAENARVARELGIGLVTFHAGFLPEEPGHALRAVMLERVRDIAAEFAEQGVRVALETGQESAATLLGVLAELGNASGAEGAASISVNFDPANMILYGMGDPVAALHQLVPFVAQVHIKDAVASLEPGVWGEERTAGTGSVDWDSFLKVLEAQLPGIDLMIEREAREDRVEDVRAAAALLRGKLGARAHIPEPRS